MTFPLNIMQAALLGAVQGITEFLPVSSSGHLILFRYYLRMPKVPLLFDVFLHVATLIVVCFFYRTTLSKMIVALYHLITKNTEVKDKIYIKYFFLIVVSTVFTIVIALVLRKVIPDQPSVLFIAIMMIITAIILLYRPINKKNDRADFSDLKISHAIITGIAQGFGTLPGISRSGITISTGLLSGMKREVAGEFAFILSIPAILGALVLTSFDYSGATESISFLPVLVGSFVAAITGFFSLKMLLWLVNKARLWVFSIYLFCVSVAILITSV